ncbi:MAG: DUF7024 domain-containing protein [Beijerinckiaceae bacterium]
MRIALFNAFPNLSHSAEIELIRRFIHVFGELGHEAVEVMCSDEIVAFAPDLVLVTHEFVPKMTDHFTAGALWSPTRFYKNDEDRLKSIRSWDLIVPINDATRQFGRDIHFPLRDGQVVSPVNLYPSSPVIDIGVPDPANLSLAYVGVHWDQGRHKDLFLALKQRVDLNVYGPAAAWDFIKGCYRGPIPFDGKSLAATLNRHGAVLAIHKTAHRLEGTPSMRVFEGAAAKCLVITDPLEPIVRTFGDSLVYVDMLRGPSVVAIQIAKALAQDRANPDEFRDRIGRMHSAFAASASLEQNLRKLVADVGPRIADYRKIVPHVSSDPCISAIMRVGSRPIDMIDRAVSSLRRQTYRHFGLLFVRFAEIDGFDAYVDQLRAEKAFEFIRVIQAKPGYRSTALCEGLRAVETSHFAILDDDDELFCNHYERAVKVMRQFPEMDIVYSGGIKCEEDGLYLNQAGRFAGDLDKEIKETRELKFFDDFNLDRLLRLDNYILPGSLVGKSSLLRPHVLEDPCLEVEEDVYFLLMLASFAKFTFSGSVSMKWNWRSLARNNSMTNVPLESWQADDERLRRRLAQLTFPDGYAGRYVVGKGRRGVSFLRKSQGLFTVDSSLSLENIDFSIEDLRSLILRLEGFGNYEPWGRWTIGPTCKIHFREPLPRKFSLAIHGHSFGPNIGAEFMVEVGESRGTYVFSGDGKTQVPLADFETLADAVTITINIPFPTAPNDLYPESGDLRKLGLALNKLKIVAFE